MGLCQGFGRAMSLGEVVTKKILSHPGSLLSGLSVAVLCGGRSRRFGSNKSLALINGRPLVQHLCEEINPLTNDLFLVTKKSLIPLFAFLDLRVVAEPYQEFASLLGIRQALESAHHDWVFIVAVDLACLQAQFIEQLWDQRTETMQAIIPQTDRSQPLAALYHRSFLPRIKKRCQEQKFRLQELGSYDEVFAYPCPSEYESCLHNVNYPEDLKEIELSRKFGPT
jgi:molybdenum cofactor guanylyltransferase